MDTGIVIVVYRLILVTAIGMLGVAWYALYKLLSMPWDEPCTEHMGRVDDIGQAQGLSTRLVAHITSRIQHRRVLHHLIVSRAGYCMCACMRVLYCSQNERVLAAVLGSGKCWDSSLSLILAAVLGIAIAMWLLLSLVPIRLMRSRAMAPANFVASLMWPMLLGGTGQAFLGYLVHAIPATALVTMFAVFSSLLAWVNLALMLHADLALWKTSVAWQVAFAVLCLLGLYSTALGQSSDLVYTSSLAAVPIGVASGWTIAKSREAFWQQQSPAGVRSAVAAVAWMNCRQAKVHALLRAVLEQQAVLAAAADGLDGDGDMPAAQASPAWSGAQAMLAGPAVQVLLHELAQYTAACEVLSYKFRASMEMQVALVSRWADAPHAGVGSAMHRVALARACSRHIDAATGTALKSLASQALHSAAVQSMLLPYLASMREWEALRFCAGANLASATMQQLAQMKSLQVTAARVPAVAMPTPGDQGMASTLCNTLLCAAPRSITGVPTTLALGVQIPWQPQHDHAWAHAAASHWVQWITRMAVLQGGELSDVAQSAWRAAARSSVQAVDCAQAMLSPSGESLAWSLADGSTPSIWPSSAASTIWMLQCGLGNALAQPQAHSAVQAGSAVSAALRQSGCAGADLAQLDAWHSLVLARCLHEQQSQARALCLFARAITHTAGEFVLSGTEPKLDSDSVLAGLGEMAQQRVALHEAATLKHLVKVPTTVPCPPLRVHGLPDTGSRDSWACASASSAELMARATWALSSTLGECDDVGVALVSLATHGGVPAGTILHCTAGLARALVGASASVSDAVQRVEGQQVSRFIHPSAPGAVRHCVRDIPEWARWGVAGGAMAWLAHKWWFLPLQAALGRQWAAVHGSVSDMTAAQALMRRIGVRVRLAESTSALPHAVSQSRRVGVYSPAQVKAATTVLHTPPVLQDLAGPMSGQQWTSVRAAGSMSVAAPVAVITVQLVQSASMDAISLVTPVSLRPPAAQPGSRLGNAASTSPAEFVSGEVSSQPRSPAPCTPSAFDNPAHGYAGAADAGAAWMEGPVREDSEDDDESPAWFQEARAGIEARHALLRSTIICYNYMACRSAQRSRARLRAALAANKIDAGMSALPVNGARPSFTVRRERFLAQLLAYIMAVQSKTASGIGLIGCSALLSALVVIASISSIDHMQNYLALQSKLVTVSLSASLATSSAALFLEAGHGAAWQTQHDSWARYAKDYSELLSQLSSTVQYAAAAAPASTLTAASAADMGSDGSCADAGKAECAIIHRPIQVAALAGSAGNVSIHSLPITQALSVMSSQFGELSTAITMRANGSTAAAQQVQHLSAVLHANARLSVSVAAWWLAHYGVTFSIESAWWADTQVVLTLLFSLASTVLLVGIGALTSIMSLSSNFRAAMATLTLGDRWAFPASAACCPNRIGIFGKRALQIRLSSSVMLIAVVICQVLSLLALRDGLQQSAAAAQSSAASLLHSYGAALGASELDAARMATAQNDMPALVAMSLHTDALQTGLALQPELTSQDQHSLHERWASSGRQMASIGLGVRGNAPALQAWCIGGSNGTLVPCSTPWQRSLGQHGAAWRLPASGAWGTAVSELPWYGVPALFCAGLEAWPADGGQANWRVARDSSGLQSLGSWLNKACRPIAVPSVQELATTCACSSAKRMQQLVDVVRALQLDPASAQAAAYEACSAQAASLAQGHADGIISQWESSRIVAACATIMQDWAANRTASPWQLGPARLTPAFAGAVPSRSAADEGVVLRSLWATLAFESTHAQAEYFAQRAAALARWVRIAGVLALAVYMAGAYTSLEFVWQHLHSTLVPSLRMFPAHLWRPACMEKP